MTEQQRQKIAKKAREDFEKNRIPKAILKKLYSSYNPKVDAEQFVTEAEKLFPNLNCGLATVYLQKLLGGEIVQGKYKNEKHTFLALNKKIIDITADQFGGPRVYIGKLQFPWSEI